MFVCFVHNDYFNNEHETTQGSVCVYACVCVDPVPDGFSINFQFV